MPQTIVEKIAQAHLAEGPKRPLRTGDFISVRPHHVMTHDNTSAVMSKFKGIGAKQIHDPKQLVFALDHDIQNKDETNQKKYRAPSRHLRQVNTALISTPRAPASAIRSWWNADTLSPDLSSSPPTRIPICTARWERSARPSSAPTPPQSGQPEKFWWQIPRSIEVVLEGKLPEGATGKDIIITLCGLYNHDEVLNAAVEFSGPGVASLSMDARFSISNMTTEWGPLVGWFPVDEITIRYLKNVHQRLKAGWIERFTEKDIESWTKNPPRPDASAAYAARIVLDLADVTPHVSGPDTVQTMSSVAEMEKKKVFIQKAYLLSCVNSRVDDLDAAAKVLKGKKVSPGVKFYLGAASKWVQEEAEKRGIWQTLLDAGAKPLPAGCGPCIGLGVGLLEPGEVGISATNRNFKGRMGSRDAKCYLASPEVVAASAVAGYIRGPREMSDHTSRRAATPSLHPVPRQRKSTSFPAFPNESTAASFSCRKTT